MAEICTRKLVVEVCNAKNLMPKDGQGTASAYAIVDFDGQRRRTKTKFRDLNPQWDEKMEFLVHDTDSMAAEILEINLYNDKKTGKRSTFLGKVKLSGTTFVQSGSEALVYYPLEKRSVFSQIKGEIGLKVFYVDEDPPAAAAEASGEQKAAEADSAKLTEEKPSEDQKQDEKAETKPEPEEAKKAEEEKPKEEEKKEDKSAAEPENAKKEEPPSPALPPAEVENPPLARSEESKQIAIEKTANGKLAVSELELQSLSSNRSHGAYDLVDRMPFLYVRVVKVKRSDSESKSPAYAKLVIGTHSVKTKTQSDNREWDQVFAFDKEGLNSTHLEVSIWTEEKE